MSRSDHLLTITLASILLLRLASDTASKISFSIAQALFLDESDTKSGNALT